MEADSVGLQLASRACFDPKAAIEYIISSSTLTMTQWIDTGCKHGLEWPEAGRDLISI